VRCPGCGYLSFDLFDTCKRCGTPMVASSGVPGVQPEATIPEVLEVGEQDLEQVLFAGTGTAVHIAEDPFRIDDDLFLRREEPAAPPPVSDPDPFTVGVSWTADEPGAAEPTFALAGDGVHGEPIIDRYDEVPERCWAPEIAGLGRRGLALLVDQTILAGVLGVFFLGASLALRLNDVDPGLLQGAAGLQASVLPFALLGALASFAYHGYFHGMSGRTPGKALLGIEVRTGDGDALSFGRAAVRWLAATLGLGCGGVGVLWAVFEPRRRGWADLISRTVVALPLRQPAEEAEDSTRR
jgi:uncharacterized RDD family membrane protein YckC